MTEISGPVRLLTLHMVFDGPVYLDLCFGVPDPVMAHARFSLLDQAGQPLPSHSQTTRTNNFRFKATRRCNGSAFACRT